MNESRLKNSFLPNCQICQKSYDSYYHVPRVLPKCGHTFCEKCIKSKLVQKRGRLTFICPQCDSQTQIRKSVEDELPKNITIADLVKDVKYRAVGENESNDKNAQNCKIHGRKLQMICVKCGGIKVCSHCAIFGSHKGHEMRSQISATSQDIKQLNECILITQDTINQILLPNSPSNLQKQSKIRLTTSLQSYIKQNFKQYYQELTRRQQQLLLQCQSITLDQKTAEYVDDILTDFQMLKIKEMGVEQVGRSQIQNLIQKAKELHNRIQSVVEGVNKSVDAFLQQAKIKIKDVTFFEVQLVEKRNLKAILKSQSSPSPKPKKQESINKSSLKQSFISKVEQPGEPVKNQKKQSLQVNSNPNTKLKVFNGGNTSRIKTAVERPLKPQNVEQSNFNSNTSTINYSNKVNKQIVEGKEKQVKNNYSSTIEKEVENVGKVTSKNGKASSVRKSEICKTPQKNIQREKSPIHTIADNELKFIKTTKQLNYELRPKFQSIITEIDRQHPEGTLQLIGLQICDQLIPYICEYLQSKKLKFSMIKLVKNQITDEGARILLSYLSTDTYTKVLNLTSNQLTQKTLQLLLAFINTNNILKTVYISHNKINSMQLKRVQSPFQAKFVQVVL